MFELVIDGTSVRTDQYVEPLIKQLDVIAQGNGFEVATIRMVT